jgi:phosphate transport system ATP-binding protein
VLLDGEDILTRRVKQDIAAAARQGSAWCSRSRRRSRCRSYDNIAFGVRLYEKLSVPRWTSRVEEALRRAHRALGTR